MESNKINNRNIKDVYKIESTIGRGSFSTVKKIKNRKTKEYFAVKVYSKSKISEEENEIIQTEIQILQQIDHPNIVKLIDIFEDEKHICLVMELLNGGELYDLILERDKFNEFWAREAIKILIDAIRYCHQLGIIHRDIKPSNLLLGSKEQGVLSLKIADFGLARHLEPDQLASTTCGSPGYLAPEILNLQPYGKQCDYWSLGVITYVLLSGYPPFFDENRFEVLEKTKSCLYDFDEQVWQNVSTLSKDFISKLLVKDPNQRLNFDQMLEHPWMKMELNVQNKQSIDKKKLKKYINISKAQQIIYNEKEANNDI